MHFFWFTNRLLQLVLLNSCLNYCCLRNCLRPERSPPASGMGSNRDFEHEVPPPVQRPHAPMPEPAENTPAAENCLSSSSSSISSSSSCSEALVSCRKRFVKRKKCIRRCGWVGLNVAKCISFIQKNAFASSPISAATVSNAFARALKKSISGDDDPMNRCLEEANQKCIEASASTQVPAR